MSAAELSLRGASGVGAAEPVVVEQPDATEPTWKWTVKIEGPDEPCGLFVGVQCINMPPGSSCQFTVPPGETEKGESWEGIDSGRRTITHPNESFTLLEQWPAGVVTEMTVLWWDEGETPEPGASIQPVIGIETQAVRLKVA